MSEEFNVCTLGDFTIQDYQGMCECQVVSILKNVISNQVFPKWISPSAHAAALGALAPCSKNCDRPVVLQASPTDPGVKLVWQIGSWTFEEALDKKFPWDVLCACIIYHLPIPGRYNIKYVYPKFPCPTCEEKWERWPRLSCPYCGYVEPKERRN